MVPSAPKLRSIWLYSCSVLVCSSKRWLSGGGPQALGHAGVCTGRLCTSLCWGCWEALVLRWVWNEFVGLGLLHVWTHVRCGTSLAFPFPHMPLPTGTGSASSLVTQDRKCRVSSRFRDRELFVHLVHLVLPSRTSPRYQYTSFTYSHSGTVVPLRFDNRRNNTQSTGPCAENSGKLRWSSFLENIGARVEII